MELLMMNSLSIAHYPEAIILWLSARKSTAYRFAQPVRSKERAGASFAWLVILCHPVMFIYSAAVFSSITLR